MNLDKLRTLLCHFPALRRKSGKPYLFYGAEKILITSEAGGASLKVTPEDFDE